MNRMSDRRPIPILRSPELVEAAVRTTLREALGARHLRAGDIDPRSFGNRAIEVLREAAECAHKELDAFALYELETAALAAASVLLSSNVGRRLLAVDPRRVKIPAPDFDAAVTDRAGARHMVRFELCASDAARSELMQRLASLAGTAPAVASAVAAAPRKNVPTTLHLLSLRDGRTRTLACKPALQATA